ncbi:RNA polymerase sigma factor, sigma-70 family [Promicromonospora umidemergens]|uniref:RNA polymerase sigma factor (Sigma-70 family) n=1 Tax=Promicromonospora umidemergens TaxID=629679 RepID=A0ABP8X2G3_9MICO|nr:sigma-70 family RNA polymerase sigma factor [Promicromonospora umidemergens]MCP2285027.1 RNA polymerase sigma factor, sigma-70 family [Promicromonospora umidemergens]
MTQWEVELTELATRRGGALVGYAYSLCQDRAQAEDLVQDALVKVFSRLRRPTGSGDGGQDVVHLDQPQRTNTEGYVRRAILTIYLDGYRRQKNWSGFKHLLADDDRSPAADRVATARVDVGVALAQLSPRQREAVVLRFFEDLTVPQIAAALGTRPGTIKRYLSDAMELLRASLAEVVAPETDSSLDERLDVVAGAVRRRRATKVGAVAGVSMVLAVALVWGAWAVEPWIRSEPLPADDKVEYTPGYVPGNWSDDAGVYCGMPVEELEALDAGTFEVEVTGGLAPRADGTSTSWEVPVTVTGTVPDDMADDERGYFMTSPLIVWAQDGRVVDLGTGWREMDSEVSSALSEEGAWSGPATAGNSTTCLEDTLVEGGVGDEYDNERPGASYELRVVMTDSSASGQADGQPDLLVSDPATVDLDSGVASAPTFGAPSGDCSGAAYAGRGLRAQDLPERTRAATAELLAAVITCDERKVAELGGALDTAPLSQSVSPSVNEVFALPEADGQVPYATVARLLTETRPAVDASGLAWPWPRVSRSVDDDAAWQEAIDAGAITEEQAATDRAKGVYTGWRLEVDDNGEPSPVTWRGFYEGDDSWCSRPDAEPGCS